MSSPGGGGDVAEEGVPGEPPSSPPPVVAVPELGLQLVANSSGEANSGDSAPLSPPSAVPPPDNGGEGPLGPESDDDGRGAALLSREYSSGSVEERDAVDSIPTLEPEPELEPGASALRVSRIIPKGLIACQQCGVHLAYADVADHECIVIPGQMASGNSREEQIGTELWVPDEYVERCEASGCAKVFGFTVGKHHCRCCGRVFCKGCSSGKADFAQPWQWQTDRGVWKRFSSADQKTLNEADASGQRIARIEHGEFNYTVDFDRGVQTNDRTGRERAVQGGAGLVRKERVCNSCLANLASGDMSVAEASQWRLGAKWEVLIDQGWTSYDQRQSQELEMAYQYDQATKDISTPARDGARDWRYRVDLHAMVQQNLTHEARKMRGVRRTGPSGKLQKLQQQQRKCVTVEPVHRHNLRNESGQTLVLQPLGKFSGPPGVNRWLEPPPGMIAPGEHGQWTSTGPPCDVTYLMQESKSEVVLRLGAGTTYHGFINPHHSNPKLSSDEKLPQLRCPQTVGVGLQASPHEWAVMPSRVEQPPSATVGGSVTKQRPSWLPMHLTLLESVGLGSSHISIQWVATMLVTADFSEEDVAKAVFHSPRSSEILPDAVKGDRVVVVGGGGEDGYDPEWMRVKRITAEGETTPIKTGLLPTCILEAPCTQQSWEVEVSMDPPNKNHPPKVLRMGRELDTGRISAALLTSNSLFDLDTRTELALEYRQASAAPCTMGASTGGAGSGAGVWHAIIRGLEPSQSYKVRVRSVLADPWVNARSRTSVVATSSASDSIGGDWSSSLKMRTRQIAEPSLSWWDAGAWLARAGASGGEAVNGGKLEIGGSGPHSKLVRCKLERRWVRIRPPIGGFAETTGTGLWSGMDVLWRLSVQKLSQVPWKVSIFREGRLPLTDGDTAGSEADTVSGASGGRVRQKTGGGSGRPVPVEVVQGTGAGLQLCGRIHAERGEVIRLEWEAAPSTVGPPGAAASAAKDQTDEIECSWRALSSSSQVEVVQSASANPRAAESKGRYLRIDHRGKNICVTDICVYDYDGLKIQPISVAASSILSDDAVCYPAAHAIDGKLSTFCCTGGVGPQWLRLDFGEIVSVGCIEIVNRLDQNPRLGISQLSLAVVSLTEDLEATKRAWTTQIQENQLIYRFVFQHRSQAQALQSLSPAPAVDEEGMGLSSALEDYPEPDFAKLERLVESIEDSRVELPSTWENVDGDWEVDVQGVTMPFSNSGGAAAAAPRAVEGKIYKTFNSQAKPHWLKLRDRGGIVVDAVFKRGDDLRQDQLVIGMLQLFNRIWKEEGVTHIANGGAAVAVEHPIYAVAAVGTDRGLVQMLPNSKPVDKMVAHETRAKSDWRASNEMIPSAVATFIAAYVLNIRDRHQGNMVVVAGKRLANIDFGWLDESPGIDTGMFPIPEGLKQLLTSTNLWDEFIDLCWDAVSVLHAHLDEIIEHWQRILVDRELNDRNLAEDYPTSLTRRLLIQRADLDSCVVTGGGSWKTLLKNVTHARHEGAGEVFRVIKEEFGLSPSLLGGGDSKLEPEPEDEEPSSA